MWALILIHLALSLANVDDQIQAEIRRDWSMMTNLLIPHADWLRLLAVLGSMIFDWLSTVYYIPLTAIGWFRFGKSALI